MAKSLQKKASIPIQPGTIVRGKWNQKEYAVQHEIGAGMVGTVFLCRHQKKLVALKISAQAMSMTTEVNVLKSLNKVQDNRLGPFLLDVDDWETKSGKVYSFYVMEYVKGMSLEKFIHRNGDEWIGVFLIQILEQLERLHEAGWVFGDLKNDNLLIAGTPPRIQFIDVGGTTKIGRSIKEYSEFYDRAYWYLGSREAEPSYDLFALVMVVLTIFYPSQFKRTTDTRQFIFRKIAAVRELQLLRPVLQKAITGKYRRAKDMKEDILQRMMKQHVGKKSKQREKTSHVAEALWVTTISSIYYIMLYLLF